MAIIAVAADALASSSQLLSQSIITANYLLQSKSIYTQHVVHMWITKKVGKELQRELIINSTITIHRQVYDLYEK